MGIKVANGESQLEIGEAGIILDDSPAICGKGYAVEALNTVSEYGFDMLGLDEIRVRTMEVNTAMRGIIECNFGFDKIRNLVKSDIAPDGPKAGGGYESVGDASLGRMKRYWKLYVRSG